MLESLFNKAAGLLPYNFIKKRLQHRCFSVKFAKLLSKPILKNIQEWLLLHVVDSYGHLTHFKPVLYFYTPIERQKNIDWFGFLTFSKSIRNRTLAGNRLIHSFLIIILLFWVSLSMLMIFF